MAQQKQEQDLNQLLKVRRDKLADLLGISQSYISRLEKRIMVRLKKEIVRYE